MGLALVVHIIITISWCNNLTSTLNLRVGVIHVNVTILRLQACLAPDRHLICLCSPPTLLRSSCPRLWDNFICLHSLSSSGPGYSLNVHWHFRWCFSGCFVG